MTEKNMKHDFGLNTSERRMPYTVPEKFFADLERSILQTAESIPATTTPKHHRTLIRTLISAVATMAAGMALFFTFSHSGDKQQGMIDDFTDVEQAFAQLSSADQDYILQVYQDDLFLNEQ